MSAEVLLILPLVIPLATAVAALLGRRFVAFQQWLSVTSMAVLLAAEVLLLIRVGEEGILAIQVGHWPAPFGITLVADHLAAILLVVSGIIGLTSAVYSVADVTEKRVRYGFYSLLHILMMGISGAFLTGDVFNLYVWFEVMLIASFALMALGNEPRQLEGALKYTVISLVGSALLLTAVGLLYGLTGTLNMADMAVRLADVRPGLVISISMLFLAAFGLKSAVFPLFFWLPASYHTPPVTVSALFAGLLTKVGVYALIRVFTLIFTQDVAYTHGLLLWVAGLTMITGVLGAVSQKGFRRILSFHIISQIGYMVMGLALFTPLALLGAVFYIVHHIFVKTNLFYISGIALRIGGSFDIHRIGGLFRRAGILSALFVISAFSLAGFPPLSGFWAKYILVRAGIEAGTYVIVAVALVVGFLTLFSMAKVWQEAFLAPAQGSGAGFPSLGSRIVLFIPVVLLAGITLALGLYAAPLYELSARAAEELLQPDLYIRAVLGP